MISQARLSEASVSERITEPQSSKGLPAPNAGGLLPIYPRNDVFKKSV